jgi:hypothetical protein
MLIQLVMEKYKRMDVILIFYIVIQRLLSTNQIVRSPKNLFKKNKEVQRNKVNKFVCQNV